MTEPRKKSFDLSFWHDALFETNFRRQRQAGAGDG